MMSSLIAVAVVVSGLASAQELTLVDEVALDAQSVPKGESVDLTLPALPARAGHAIVLTLRAVITSRVPSGCNYNGQLSLNGAALTRYSPGGGERLIGRLPSLELARGDTPPFSVFSGDRAMVMFAPDVDTGDEMTTDGLGASFVLEVSDAAHGVDGNTLTLTNLLPGEPEAGFGDLSVADIAVGYVPRDSLPQPASEVPERGPIARSVRAGKLRLAQSSRGGFMVRAGRSELRIETGIGMTPGTPSVLIADDGAAEPAEVQVSVEPLGDSGFRTIATWPGLTLERTVLLGDGRVDWRETWTNDAGETRGVPFRHRLFLREPVRRAYLGGSSDSVALAGCAPNPTLFLEDPSAAGEGFGVTAESDWLRLLMALRMQAGVGEVLSETLCLGAGESVALQLTLEPVGEGGYWGFINGVRERWGANGTTNERPMFWGYARAEDDDPDECVRKSLSHLGPIRVVIGPWQRLEPDSKIIRAGRYPKLPEDAPRTEGGCPDLDVDAFLTLAHREPYWTQLGIDVDRIHRTVPDALVMQMIHPAMEAVYRPAQDRWAIADDAIHTPDGSVFQSGHYSRAWVGDYVEKDWGVLYYSPRPGSAYAEQIMSGVRRGLDQYGLDGIYCDEFSWAGTRRDYSRYDYGSWDGHSADLDDSGDVVRLKSDNGWVTQDFQTGLVDEVLGRGLFFLGNGGNALRSLADRPHARFVEGGNGAMYWVQGHLHPTPLVLGNMGDQKTLPGVMASARKCLALGCVYSPTAVNLLLDGPDNFVCKLYPITVREIGPGWVIGDERLITSVSRSFDWPAEPSDVRVLRYSADGTLLPVDDADRAAAPFDADVPEGGLVVAEVR